MIKEVMDKNSGAILFKKDPDSLRQEELLKLVYDLEKRISKLEKKIKDFEESK